MLTMSHNDAKRLVATKAAQLGLKHGKLTSKKVSFAGFGYGEAIFVKVHDPESSDKWYDLKQATKGTGVVIEF